MLLFGFPCVLWLFGLLQLAGVAFLARLQVSALRLPEKCPCRKCRTAFFTALLLLGFNMIWLLANGWGEWVVGCPTFAIMILGSTFDSGRHARPVC